MSDTTPNPARGAELFRYGLDGGEGPLRLPDGRVLTDELCDELADLAERAGSPAGWCR